MKRKDVMILTLTPGILVILMIVFFLLQFGNATKDFKLIDNKEITKGIFSVQGKIVNIYLIKMDDGNYISIDAGDEPDVIKKNLDKLKISPDKVNIVFLTHSDFDHAGALDLFKNAKVYVSEKEEDVMNGKIRRSLLFTNKPISKPYTKMNENEIIEFGTIKIKGIPSYGHTPGSFSFLVNDKFLFSGDNLLLKNNKAGTFPRFFTKDTNTQKKSIKELAKLENIKYIFTAHSGYSENFDEAMKSWK